MLLCSMLTLNYRRHIITWSIKDSPQHGDFMVHAPGLEPKSSSKEPFLLLREISTQCLEDIRKGKTGTVKQLLALLSGVTK